MYYVKCTVMSVGIWCCASIFNLCQTLDFRNASVWERKWQEGEWERKWTTATTKRRAWHISPSDRQTFFTPVRGRSFACCTFCEWASFSGTFCNNALKMKTFLLRAVSISFTLHFLKIPNHFMYRRVFSFLAIWTAIYISDILQHFCRILRHQSSSAILLHPTTQHT